MLLRYLLTRQCEISLPQKTSRACRTKRFQELRKKKKIWDLQKSKWGFALLDVEDPWSFIARAFIDPFRRFYIEGYLQTVIVSDLSGAIYRGLVNNITKKEISHNYNYQVLSKYFELAAKLGGVSFFVLFFMFSFCLLVCFFFLLAIFFKTKNSKLFLGNKKELKKKQL